MQAESLGAQAIEEEYDNYKRASLSHHFEPGGSGDATLPHHVTMHDTVGGVYGEQWQLPFPGLETSPSLVVEPATGALAFNNGYYVKLDEQSGVANDLNAAMDAFTLNIWYKSHAETEGLNLIQHLYQQGDAEGITLRLNGGQLEGAICGRIAGAYGEHRSTHVTYPSHTHIEPSDWQMATLVFDGLSGTLQLYVDGSLIETSLTDLDSVAPGQDMNAPYFAAIGAPSLIQ